MTEYSTYKSYDVRSFYSIIKSVDFLDINNKVKQWMKEQENHIFDVCVSNADTVFYKNSYQQCVKISGIVEDSEKNDNDIFFKLYSLFEYLFINLEKKVDISFLFEGLQEKKLYKILPVKKISL